MTDVFIILFFSADFNFLARSVGKAFFFPFGKGDFMFFGSLYCNLWGGLINGVKID